MTLIFAILMVAIVVSIGGYILSLYLNTYVFVDLIYNLQKINFVNNHNIVIDKVIYQYGWVYINSSWYNKIFGLYGFVLPKQKNWLWIYTLETWGELYISGNNLIVNFKEIVKWYSLSFSSSDDQWKFIPKWTYSVEIFSNNNWISDFSIYVSGDNFKKAYPIDYLSGTFLIKIDEFLPITKDYSKLTFEKYPKFLIDLIKLYSISTQWEKYNIVHFNASGVDKRWFLYFSGFANVNPPVNIVVEWYTYTGCDKILRGIYYNGSWYYYPLYSGDLQVLQNNGVYTWLILSGWIYSNCDNDIFHLFGQIDYYYTPDGITKNKILTLYAWRKYNFDTNSMQNITWSTLWRRGPVDSVKIIWFVYDDSIWVWFIWWKFNNQSIFKDLLNYSNTVSVLDAISSIENDKINFKSSIWWYAFRKLFY